MEKACTIMFCALLAVFLGGCDLNKVKFDPALMAGHWQAGTVHEYYNANGTGYTWDTADDVTEEEAQPFNWTLQGATLTQNHKMEMGGIVPKTYTLTKLNTTVLCYHDSYGTTYNFTKLNQ